MGIQGLLPLLKSIQQPICLSELAGSTVGVDVYGWLHKGAYGCALELAEGNDSDMYVKYVMRRVNMMLYYKVKPILVFDGGYLPSKSEKEAERRGRRKDYRSQGLQHLKNGKRTEALECFQKSIDITPEMALNVMKACREKGIDCIVAPYEADAQLAYLMKIGVTQYTISEDSDLLVYECEKVVFKMDANGSGLLIDLKHLPKLKSLRMEGFTRQKFREMCILSGCDYLKSIKGMGLMTAHKMLKNHSSVKKLFSALRLDTKKAIPRDYEQRFEKAEQTFLYQIVFDPNTNKLVPLNPLPKDMDSSSLVFAGHDLKWKEEQALDLALGNLNPLTGVKIASFKLSKVLTSDEKEQEQLGSRAERLKQSTLSIKSSICPQIKKSQTHAAVTMKNKISAKSVNCNAEKNSKKSSEVFTLLGKKRTRIKSETLEENKEKSKLARIFSTSWDEITVDVNFESETTGPQCPRNVGNGLKIRRNNPFRSPVMKTRDEETVVSRYFGLAGMESVTKEIKGRTGCERDTDKTEQSSLLATLGSDEKEFQESGCLSDSKTVENSPTQPGNCGVQDEEILVDCAPKQSRDNVPPSPFLSSTFPPLPRFPFSPHSEHAQDVNHSNDKSPTTQMSLDKFAFKKETVASFDAKDKENCTIPLIFDDFTTQPCCETRNPKGNGKSSNDINAKSGEMTKTRPKFLGLRMKATNGLGRCRNVGLQRPQKHTKHRKENGSKKTDGKLPSLFHYLSYQSREKVFEI